MSMKMLINGLLVVAFMAIVGCGEQGHSVSVRKQPAGATIAGMSYREYCYQGVVYILYSHSMTAKFGRDGKVVLCD